MKTFKTRSLSDNHTDDGIKNGCYTIGFLSFERAIRESLQLNKDKSKPVGYRVTEQGIEICFD